MSKPKSEPKSELKSELKSDLLYVEDVAALARKSVATIRWLRAMGRGPRSGKLGNRVVFLRSDVDAWIASAFQDGAA